MRFFKMLLMWGMVAIMGTTAMASSEHLEPPERKYCSTTFHVVDETDGGYVGDIVVVFTDVADTSVEGKRFATLTHSAGYAGNDDVTHFGLVADTVYTVEFGLRGDGGVAYEVVNEDGSPIGAIATTEDELELRWMIRPVSGDSPHREDGEVASADISGSDMLERFIERTSFMEDNEGYWVLTELVGDVFRQRFIETTGQTEEEWDRFTGYEKFYISSLYLRPVMYSTSGNYDMYMRDLDTFLGRYSFDIMNALDLAERRGVEGADIVRDALIEALTFQYNYFLENGSMLNIFTGERHAGGGGAGLVDIEVEIEGRQEQERQILDELMSEDDGELRELVQEISAEENRSNLTQSGTFLGALKDRWVTLLMATLAIVAAGGVAYVRKKRDDDGTSD